MYIKPSKYKAYGVKIKITCMFMALYRLFPTKIGVNKMLSAAIMVLMAIKSALSAIFNFIPQPSERYTTHSSHPVISILQLHGY